MTAEQRGKQMSKHTPGPWRVDGWVNRRAISKHWTVSRDLSPTEVQWLENENGRRKRFRSEAAAERARAAIAKATGQA